MKYDSLIMFTAGIKRCDQTCGEKGKHCGLAARRVMDPGYQKQIQ